MKLFDEQHLTKVEQCKHPLYENGPPPDDGQVGTKMLSYLVALERTLSPKAARSESGLSMLGYEDCTMRSSWFCRMVNNVAAFSQDEAVWTAISRANVHTKADENGSPLIDADGKVMKFGVSEAASRMVVEDRLRTAQVVQLPRGDGPEMPPLLPSNINQHRQMQIDDCHLALNALRPAVQIGDRQAIDSFVKVQDRLAKLSGADAPKTTVSYIGGNANRLSDDELFAIASGQTLIQGPDGVFSAPADADAEGSP